MLGTEDDDEPPAKRPAPTRNISISPALLRLPTEKGVDVKEKWNGSAGSGKWVLNIDVEKGCADAIFRRLVSAGRAGLLSCGIKARVDKFPGGTLAIIMVYSVDYRDEVAQRQLVEQLVAHGVDGGPYSFKPNEFTAEGRYGKRAAAGLQGTSDFPTGIWRFKASGGRVIGFERVEPSLKDGPPFWADSGGAAAVRSQGLTVPAAVVKPGSRMATLAE